MPHGLETHFKKELKMYRGEFEKRNFLSAWQHFERAHIIGPAMAKRTYLRPLADAEVWLQDQKLEGDLGTNTAILVGGVKSFVGKIPVGNTGGANVPPLQPMEIPEDIKAMMKPYVKL